MAPELEQRAQMLENAKSQIMAQLPEFKKKCDEFKKQKEQGGMQVKLPDIGNYNIGPPQGQQGNYNQQGGQNYGQQGQGNSCQGPPNCTSGYPFCDNGTWICKQKSAAKPADAPTRPAAGKLLPRNCTTLQQCISCLPEWELGLPATAKPAANARPD